MPNRNHNHDPDGSTAPGGPPSVQDASVRLPCPLCNEAIELPEANGPHQVVCPSCKLSCQLDPAQIQQEEAERTTSAAVAKLDDLGLWLAGEPIPSRAKSRRERFSQWRREHPVLLSALVICFGLLAGVATAAIRSYVRAASALSQQQTENRRHRETRAELEGLLGQAKQRLARVDRLEQDVRQRTQREYQARLTEAEGHLQQALFQKQQAQRQAQTAFTHHLALRARQLETSDPRRSMLLAAEALEFALERGDRPSAAAHQLLRDRIKAFGGFTMRGHEGRITSLKFSDDGRWLASSGYDGAVKLWNVDQKIQSAAHVLQGHRNCVTRIAFSSSNRLLATASSDAMVCLWDMTSLPAGKKPIHLNGHQGRVSFLSFSGDGRWLIAASRGLTPRENTVSLWDLSAARPDRSMIQLPASVGALRDIIVAPAGHILATANAEGRIYLWDLRKNNPTASPRILQGGNGAIASIAFSGDGKWLACGSSDFRTQKNTVRLWNLSSERPTAPRIVGSQPSGIRQVLLSRDAQWLVATGDDGAARLWRLSANASSNQPQVLLGHRGEIKTAAVDALGNWLFTGGVDGTVRVWSLGNSGPEDAAVVLHTGQGPMAALAVHPDGHLLATAGNDHTIRTWDMRLQTLIKIARNESLPPTRVVNQADGPPEPLR